MKKLRTVCTYWNTSTPFKELYWWFLFYNFILKHKVNVKSNQHWITCVSLINHRIIMDKYIESYDYRYHIFMDFWLHGLYIGLLTGNLVDKHVDSVKVKIISGNNFNIAFSVPYVWFSKYPPKTCYGVIFRTVNTSLFLVLSFLVLSDNLLRSYAFRISFCD